jgi:hypothetical protein
MLTAKQRKKEFAQLDAALRPARELVCNAVDAMVARAQQATGDGLPDIVLPSVIAELHQAIAITAAMGLPRTDCAKLIISEAEIRLVLKLEELDAEGVSELMANVRASLDRALVQQ